MRLYLVPALLVAALFVCAGCAGGGSEPRVDEATSQSAAPPRWYIQLAITGGFRGLNRIIEVDSLSDVVRITESPHPPIARPLSENDKSSIARLLDAAPATDTNTRNFRCRDCIEFELRVTRTGESYVAQFDSTTLNGSAFEQLIARIAAFGEEQSTQ